jgi:hypothetical protein
MVQNCSIAGEYSENLLMDSFQEYLAPIKLKNNKKRKNLAPKFKQAGSKLPVSEEPLGNDKNFPNSQK